MIIRLQIFSTNHPSLWEGTQHYYKLPTCSIHQSATQKMGALRECSNIFVWLIYGVSKKSWMPAYPKSWKAIQRVYALALQLRHNTHKGLNYQHPMHKIIQRCHIVSTGMSKT